MKPGTVCKYNGEKVTVNSLLPNGNITITWFRGYKCLTKEVSPGALNK